MEALSGYAYDQDDDPLTEDSNITPRIVPSSHRLIRAIRMTLPPKLKDQLREEEREDYLKDLPHTD
jgi:hypothetical protein